jgi:hypothetical protein
MSMNSRLLFSTSLACALAIGNATAADQSIDDAMKHSIEVARKTLAEHLSAKADAFEFVSIAAQTWSDSSLGCPQPGQSAAMVVTSGNEVVLKSADHSYRVHVAGERGVVCELALPSRMQTRPGWSARGLDTVIEKARSDLATRLHVEPESVQVLGLKKQQWPDSQLGCREPEKDFVDGSVRGYRITLSGNGRKFDYHTDLNQVFPCPPIEAQ